MERSNCARRGCSSSGTLWEAVAWWPTARLASRLVSRPAPHAHSLSLHVAVRSAQAGARILLDGNADTLSEAEDAVAVAKRAAGADPSAASGRSGARVPLTNGDATPGASSSRRSARADPPVQVTKAQPSQPIASSTDTRDDRAETSTQAMPEASDDLSHLRLSALESSLQR